VKTGGEEAVFPPEDFKALPNSNKNISVLPAEVSHHLHTVPLPSSASSQLQHLYLALL